MRTLKDTLAKQNRTILEQVVLRKGKPNWAKNDVIPQVSITRIASSSAQPPQILARGQQHVLRALVANKNYRHPAPHNSYSIALRTPPCLPCNRWGRGTIFGRGPPAPPKILVV